MLSRLTAIAMLIALTACAAPQSNTITRQAPPTIRAQNPSSATGTFHQPTADNNIATIGDWATAKDGIEFRISEIARAKVPAISAGGKPGAPAVVVTIQIKNSSPDRFDLMFVHVVVRLGIDGREAEPVFGGDYHGGPDGSLPPGRTSTHRRMFAAENAEELSAVSIELEPGTGYESATWEGKA